MAGGVRLCGVEVGRRRLEAYRDLCGFGPGVEVPATYPHVLAFPLHLLFMGDPAFPFAALGVVHIANTIEQRRPITSSERLDLTVVAGDASPHPRGQQITIVSEASVSDELVWRDQTVLLHRERTREAEAARSAAQVGTSAVPAEAPAARSVWELPADLGRRYASVSGDRNPIHLYDLTARPFGFANHVAHGMWTKARALAELSRLLPEAFTVEVAFKRAVPLPGSVRFGWCDHREYLDFGVSSAASGAPHLLGRVSGGGRSAPPASGGGSVAS